MFFVRVLGGRFGAKAGHHSILGSLFKIGLSPFKGLKHTARGPALPLAHTYTFDRLSKAKARELHPWVNVARLANGEKKENLPKSILSENRNLGMQLKNLYHSKYPGNLNLTRDITTKMESGLGEEGKKLLDALRDICSKEAYVSPHGAIVDPGTGLRATIARGPDGGYVVGFGCTGGLEETDPETIVDRQNQANIQQYIGFEPKVYDQAKKLVDLAVTLWGKDKVSATGHSLGGGLAQYAGLYNGVKAKCFNTSPLGVGLQQILGDRIEQAGALVEHVSMRGDWLSHSGAPLPIGIRKNEFSHKTGTDTRPRVLSHLADLLGIRTRGNFGKKHYINFDEANLKDKIKSHLRHEAKVGKPDPEKAPLVRDEITAFALGRKTEEEIHEKIDKETDKIIDKISKNTINRHCRILNQIQLLATPKRSV